MTSLDTDLRRVQATWDGLARGDDVLDVIWGYPVRRGQSPESFFASGELEIARTLKRARRWRLPRARGRALDFGCGVGRLTQAMAAHFERAVGVDVSEAMVEAARRWNRHGEHAEYVVNDSPSLARFDSESFDFVYSSIVLQHMPPELGARYVGEFARVLRPGGLLVFQVPSARAPQPRLPRRAVLAEIEPRVSSLRVPAGAEAVLHARVWNRSRAWWFGVPGEQSLQLGNHWLSEDGTLLVQDDGRAHFETDVAPGESVELKLVVRAPAEPGRYLLELDVVQQDVAWFSERRKLSARRTRTVRIPVEVGGAYEPADADPAAYDAASGLESGMEMHAIPVETVLSTLSAAGVRVLRVTDDRMEAIGWRSARYWATR